jgi:hypothetical protein
VVAGAVVVAAPGAYARSSDLPALTVTFTAAGAISFTAADGTPVGTASGQPGAISAGYYTVTLSGPGSCTITPYFELTGPGENIVDNLEQGQEWQDSYTADFLPNSTYSWRSSAAPGVVYTFTTTSTSEGAAPPLITSSGTFSGTDSHNADVVGSGVSPTRGLLTGVVSPTGKLTLSYRGKTASRLTAGDYTISLTGAKEGLLLQRAGHAPIRLAGAGPAGKSSTSVDLTPGSWIFATTAPRSTYAVAVFAA